MPAVAPYSRVVSQRLLGRSTRPFTRPVHTNVLLRVSCACAATDGRLSIRDRALTLNDLYRQVKTYATAATASTRKPRASAVRSSSAKSTSKKRGAKKTVKKPKKRAVKKSKPKKVVKKGPSKTAQALKERAARTNLRAAALLDRPKQLPSTAFKVLIVSESKLHKGNIGAAATSASAKYKALSPEERERLNHEANSNKQKNDLAYKKWVETHSPLEIKQANTARRQLNAQAKAAGKKLHHQQIVDDRVVKQPRNSYSFFFTERFASGDLQGLSVAEAGKLVGREWSQLTTSAKKVYADRADMDKARYLEEHKSVYGIDPPSVSRAKKA